MKYYIQGISVAFNRTAFTLVLRSDVSESIDSVLPRLLFFTSLNSLS